MTTRPRWARFAQNVSTAAVPTGAAVLFLTGMFAPAWVMSGIAVLVIGLAAAIAAGYHITIKENA